MSNRTADVQQILSSEDPQFRQWIEEHHQCESRLSELTSKTEVSADEELEEKTLKKRKLLLKDQMAERIRSYESSHATATGAGSGKTSKTRFVSTRRTSTDSPATCPHPAAWWDPSTRAARPPRPSGCC